MDTNTKTNTDAGITIANRYRVIKLAGRGGMGDVYLAHDLVLGRQVAIKSITSTLQGNPEIRKRVERECRLHAALPPHPGIIALYDRIEENGNVYLILEYFEGEPLSAYLERFHRDGRHLPLSAAINIVCQVLDALRHIHAHNILHRDIKPSNVMVAERPDGSYVAKLMDFGIAAPESQENQATQITMMASAAPGSPTYMAPERIDPETFGQACPATDLYAVGIMLYEMLCCHPPFQGTLTEIFVAQLSKPVNFDSLPPEISSSVKKVLQKTLNKKTVDRYSSAAEMMSELDAIRRESCRTELELSPKPEDIDTAATLLASAARRSSVMQEAVQEALAQTRKRMKRKRRFLMMCLAACTFGLLAWLGLRPVPPECESGEFWKHGGTCQSFLQWHYRMWDRKQKCESDDWWKHEQLCRDYPDWMKRKQRCESDNWWQDENKKDCKTYPQWLERKQKCESDDWWQHEQLCKNYPNWPERKQRCESDDWGKYEEDCKSYPEWLKRKQECESDDWWKYEEDCKSYPEWLKRKQECESDDFEKYEKFCRTYPDWQRRKWCLQDNVWGKGQRQYCKDYPKWHEKMKIWCQEDDYWTKKEDCREYDEWHKKMKVWCQQNNFWEKGQYCESSPEWQKLMEARHQEQKMKEWCLKSDFWNRKESNCGKYPEWHEKIKQWCQQDNFWEKRQYCEAHPEWKKLMAIRNQEQKEWCLKSDFGKQKESDCGKFPEWHEKKKQWCQQDNFWEKRQYCETYPEWQKLMEVRHQEKEQCLKGDFGKQKESDCGKYPEWHEKIKQWCQQDNFWEKRQYCEAYPEWKKLMEARHQEKEQCLKGDFWKQKESDCGKFPEWKKLMEAREKYLEWQEQIKQLCLQGNYWEKSSYCKDNMEWQKLMEARNQKQKIKEWCLSSEWWKRKESECGEIPEWQNQMKKLCQSPDCGQYPACASYSGTVCKAQPEDNKSLPSNYRPEPKPVIYKPKLDYGPPVSPELAPKPKKPAPRPKPVIKPAPKPKPVIKPVPKSKPVTKPAPKPKPVIREPVTNRWKPVPIGLD